MLRLVELALGIHYASGGSHTDLQASRIPECFGGTADGRSYGSDYRTNLVPYLPSATFHKKHINAKNLRH